MEFNKDVIIETERLILRYMKEEDTHDIFMNINHDKDVLLYFVDRYKEKEEEMTLSKLIEFCLANKHYFFAIELKDSHEVIGMIHQCSNADSVFNYSEIGYAIGKKYWNHGYVTEALKAMINFLFTMDIHKLYVAYLSGNEASRRVIEKCGMIYEGVRKDDIFYRNQYHDVHYYYLINPHHQNNN